LKAVDLDLFAHLHLHPNGQNALFWLVEVLENIIMKRKNKMREFHFHLRSAVLNNSLVFTQFIKTMELLHVQGPISSNKAVGDYLRADRLFWNKDDNFDPVSKL
jgi:hypothetical protein